jgi:hypothetical protein
VARRRVEAVAVAGRGLGVVVVVRRKAEVAVRKRLQVKLAAPKEGAEVAEVEGVEREGVVKTATPVEPSDQASGLEPCNANNRMTPRISIPPQLKAGSVRWRKRSSLKTGGS